MAGAFSDQADLKMLQSLYFIEPIHPIMDHKMIQLDRDRR
jgi:hypothetical protein